METIEEAKDIIKEQDSIIGAQMRRISFLEKSESRRIEWLRQAKKQAGYDDSVSFDTVWKDILIELKGYRGL